jgi:hypothetical protein
MAAVRLDISSGLCSTVRSSDAEGYYRAVGLPPGLYTMRINTGELTGAAFGFELATSQQLRHDIALSELAALKGSIRSGTEGNLAQWLRLVLRSDKVTVVKDSHRRAGLTKAAYEFKFLPAGRYELETISDMLGHVKYNIRLAPGETKVLDINLGRCGRLQGIITGRDGEPLAGVELSISSPGRELSATSDGEGRYSLEDLSPGYIHLTIPGGKFGGTWFDFELKKDQDRELDVDFSTAGDVKGRILKADGKPLGLAALRVESPHRTVEVVTDREGRFRSEGLFPGMCRVHVPGPVSGRVYPFELALQEDKELAIVLPP